ncbi:hypothetical protein HHI36_015877 [Cryptolaemus montrouzieri]|uniref:Aminoacylase-1 n=1 Tax=Cryptolaemus montrouzieri TaxID=559131 RepID=A0ABD2N746_9CUCU
MNVLPAELKVVIDCRLAVTEDLEEWKKTVIGWCQEAGKDVDVEFKHVLPQVPVTKLDNSNPYWAPFREAINELGIEIKPQIFSAGTDSQLLRQEGIPAIGFSPINNTPVLLHDHDEYLGIDTFLKGIDIYCGIIKKIANLEA